MIGAMTSVAIVGGGPGGYEAALVAAQMGAEVTLVDSDGIGGSAVLTDCVPSKALLAVAESASQVRVSEALGITGRVRRARVGVDLAAVNARIRDLAAAQSQDTARRCVAAGVRLVAGRGRLDGPGAVVAESGAGGSERIEAEAILLATGARPRVMDTAKPDGERILNWEQVYALDRVPERLVVVGSGVTGAEFACAYQALGSEVVLVSSRSGSCRARTRRRPSARGRLRATRHDGAAALAGGVGHPHRRRCPGDADRRTASPARTASWPSVCAEHRGPGAAGAGVRTNASGFVDVDRVSRTSVRGVYAAGDCTGVMLLASVAAMQGRIAMWHALGGAVAPLDLRTVSSNVFTDPEIATVGYTQADVDAGRVNAEVVTLPLATNARAKIQGIADGFVKVICRRGTRIVIGGVVVAPRASELIFGLALAVEQRLTVDAGGRHLHGVPLADRVHRRGGPTAASLRLIGEDGHDRAAREQSRRPGP